MIEQPGNAVVGRVVGLLVQIAQSKARRLADAEGQGWGDAVAAIFRDVAPGDAAFVAHDIHPKRRAVAERLVVVRGQAAGSVGTEFKASGEQAVKFAAAWWPG